MIKITKNSTLLCLLIAIGLIILVKSLLFYLSIDIPSGREWREAVYSLAAKDINLTNSRTRFIDNHSPSNAVLIVDQILSQINSRFSSDTKDCEDSERVLRPHIFVHILTSELHEYKMTASEFLVFTGIIICINKDESRDNSSLISGANLLLRKFHDSGLLLNILNIQDYAEELRNKGFTVKQISPKLKYNIDMFKDKYFFALAKEQTK
jgi:hypothetical protein